MSENGEKKNKLGGLGPYNAIDQSEMLKEWMDGEFQKLAYGCE